MIIKKHFELIADLIQSGVRQAFDELEIDEALRGEFTRIVAKKFADHPPNENPKFDRGKFIRRATKEVEMR